MTVTAASAPVGEIELFICPAVETCSGWTISEEGAATCEGLTEGDVPADCGAGEEGGEAATEEGGEAATEEDLSKIVSVIENNSQVAQLVEMRTQHLGPEEILIGVRVAFHETLQTKEIASLINKLEADIRFELKNAGPIFIEPELTEGN